MIVHTPWSRYKIGIFLAGCIGILAFGGLWLFLALAATFIAMQIE